MMQRNPARQRRTKGPRVALRLPKEVLALYTRCLGHLGVVSHATTACAHALS